MSNDNINHLERLGNVITLSIETYTDILTQLVHDESFFITLGMLYLGDYPGKILTYKIIDEKKFILARLRYNF